MKNNNKNSYKNRVKIFFTTSSKDGKNRLKDDGDKGKWEKDNLNLEDPDEENNLS